VNRLFGRIFSGFTVSVGKLLTKSGPRGKGEADVDSLDWKPAARVTGDLLGLGETHHQVTEATVQETFTHQGVYA
jgi:hypothetical protein